MKCIYCESEMVLIGATIDADLYVCDCGARGQDLCLLGVHFELPGEDRENWLSCEIYDNCVLRGGR